MTSTEFANSKYQPLAMPMPFGANSDSNYTAPSTTQVATSPNFLDGFPAAFSSPHSGGGQYVTRQQMNGIGNLASRYEFYKRVGGINTFNPAFASAVGGYPAGAVLDFLDGTNLHKVYSLVDNNQVDFTQSGVDGVNWALLNQDQGSARSYIISIDNVPSTSDAQVGTFRATRDGALSVESSIMSTDTSEVQLSFPVNSSSTAAYAHAWHGFGMLICSLGNGSEPTSVPPIATGTEAETFSGGLTTQWSSIMGRYSNLVLQTVSNDWIYKDFSMPQSSAYVVKDTWYCVKLFNMARRLVDIEATSSHDATATFMQFTLSGGFKLFYTV